tara:strand:+ start:1259 stop:2047 length:789 start_codon:yes stop_codon:yes gene_type:complete
MLGLSLGLGLKSSVGRFSLTNVSGLVAWYPFNTGQTIDGSNFLVEWVDASGNNNTLTNTTATNKRPEVSSGTVLWRNVASSYMDMTNPAPATKAYSVFLVFKGPVTPSGVTRLSNFLNGSNTSGSTDTIRWGDLASTSSAQLWQVFLNSITDTTSKVSTTGSVDIANEVKTIIQVRYGGGTVSGDTSFTIEIDANGGTIATAVSQTKTNTNNKTLDLNAVGINSSTNYIHGDMNEIAIYNRKVTDAEANKIRADIKARNSMT